jgi:hypothetical protein
VLLTKLKEILDKVGVETPLLSQEWRSGAPMSLKWIVVTAGVGNPEIEAAALRVAREATKLPGVVKTVAVLTEELELVCPKTNQVYGHLQNSAHRGYGYMAYKSEIVQNAFNGFWGNFDGVIWVDAGCEVLVNPISALRMIRIQDYAREHGAFVFVLNSLEIEHTKRDLFERFKTINPYETGNQIQSTWFLLAGEQGKCISDFWSSVTLENTTYVSDEKSKLPEFPEFKVHRNDQSVFSLTCKLHKVRTSSYTPAAGTGSIIGKIRASTHPIWVSRNRTGESIIPRFLQKFSR